MDQNKKNILVVDDEQSIRELIRDILEEEGYRVLLASNGVEALELAEAGEVIDLIISDIRMPVMGGVRLLEKIRECNPYPPAVIFVTGYSDVTPEEAFAHGVFAYLKKPMSITELMKAVENALNGPKKFIKRQYERITVRLFAKLMFKGNFAPVEAEALILGQGGMFVSSETLAPVGDIIKFELFFKDESVKSVSGSSEIVWQRQQRDGKYLPGLGLKFLDLSEQDEKFIAEYVLKYRPIVTNRDSN